VGGILHLYTLKKDPFPQKVAVERYRRLLYEVGRMGVIWGANQITPSLRR
jgi:hypothetical protein